VTTIYCPKCESPNSDDAIACTLCGHPFIKKVGAPSEVDQWITKRKLATSRFGLFTVLVKPMSPENALTCAVGISILGTIMLAVILADPDGLRTFFDSFESLGEGAMIVYLLVIGLSFITDILIPGYVADQRRHPNRKAIWVTTILFGWTFIGWGIAMIWAFTEPAPTIPSKELSPDR
jgi:hypothetical protein